MRYVELDGSLFLIAKNVGDADVCSDGTSFNVAVEVARDYSSYAK